MKGVHFFYIGDRFGFRSRNKLKFFLHTLFKREGRRLDSLTYIFCTDDYLLDINRRYLKHDYYTDIITFDLSIAPDAISGEIYISTDRVRDNAYALNQSFTAELHRVIFHGALHLCGYSDKTKMNQKIMRSKEDEYLKLYFK